MIRKLRFRLVLAAMLSLVLVLGIIMGVLNGINYWRIVSDADAVLNLLMENSGHFPNIDEDFEWPSKGLNYRSRELPFERRFFSALLDGDGEILETDMARIAAVDASAAEAYALNVFSGGRRAGFYGIYRYLRRETQDECTRIIFLDCGRSMAQFHGMLNRSLMISLIGLASVLALILLLSGRIVRPIARSYETQKRFISDAGHEIRTPLTIIDADAEILEMDYGSSEWLADIRQQIARLTKLTNDLIFLSRMEEQQKAMMIDFPLSDVVSETALSFQSLALTKGKRLETDVEPMLSMVGNEKQLRQLVEILLDNAIKYSDAHGSIRLKLKKQSRFVRLTVENTTDGVQKETLKNMFERFYRGDPSRNTAIRGYGIGLSIAKAVVEAHRGRIVALSEDGRTLTIAATLPVGPRDRRASFPS